MLLFISTHFYDGAKRPPDKNNKLEILSFKLEISTFL